MYRTDSGDEIFVIDGHAHGQVVRVRAGAPGDAAAGGVLDMRMGDVALEGASDLGIGDERLIRTGLCAAGVDGRPGWDIAALERLHRDWGIRGVALAAPAWETNSRVYHLYTPEGFRYLAACERLGVCNVHLYPGEHASPSDRAPYDVEDLERVASSFPGLNFIVEHGGLPWFEDFCWIATRELNIYAGLGQLMPFIITKPRYFAELLAELLFWLGPDRLIFGSDEGVESPQALIAAFMDFELPADLCAEYRVGLTLDVRRQILGENLAQLYRVKLPR
jgi:uncharacterized protein